MQSRTGCGLSTYPGRNLHGPTPGSGSTSRQQGTYKERGEDICYEPMATNQELLKESVGAVFNYEAQAGNKVTIETNRAPRGALRDPRKGLPSFLFTALIGSHLFFTE